LFSFFLVALRPERVAAIVSQQVHVILQSIKRNSDLAKSLELAGFELRQDDDNFIAFDIDRVLVFRCEHISFVGEHGHQAGT